MNGETVVGGLSLDREAQVFNFDDFKRSHGRRRKDQMIKTLEHGWVKESAKQIKVYNSIPKKLGTKRIVKVLERETKVAAEAIIDRDIINHV